MPPTPSPSPTPPLSAPTTPLPTYKQLKQSIPAHCFNRPTLRSLMYPLRDILLLVVIGYLAVRFIGFQMEGLMGVLRGLLWGVYAYVQGTVAFGLFIVGHQCGHGAFSEYRIVNDVVGYLTHTFLLVPYFSWQRSHFVHHSKNNHLLDNESHQPSLITKSRRQYETTYKLFGHYGFIFIQLLIHSVGGWLIYLFFHGTGSRRNPYTKQEYKSTPNHFSPFQGNQLFREDMRVRVGLSTLGVVGMVGALGYLGWVWGWKVVGLVYWGPYVVTFCWLVVITWLQHTEPTVPHYGQDEWSWLKGAVLTIDRNYPSIINHLHHRIGTTHVLHHIFPQIPHYHAEEANKAIIPLLGDHYRYDPTPILKVIWRLANQCHFVQELEGVQYYRSFLRVKKEEKKGEEKGREKGEEGVEREGENREGERKNL